MRPLVFFSRAGCFLPLLIILNLFFGWMFLPPLYWLAVGAGLILLFLFTSAISAKKILSQNPRSDSKVIDVEGKVVEEKKQLE